ncbi:MAG: tRNA (adenosine(37)-N6)-threonylcarbamoyltransferase complex dimerization subunit type 1 TsaB [Burkholderiales bacterium]
MNAPAHLTHLLAFDTATEHLNVVLATPQGQWLVEEAGGSKASVRLIPAIRDLLAQGACTWSDLTAIGFGRGPGAFTGLRTAASVAQGLAFGAGKPVLSIDTLMAVAQDARMLLQDCGSLIPASGHVWVVMDARMDEIYAAHYQWSHGQWHTLVQPHLTNPEALHQAWQVGPPQVVAGTALSAFSARLTPGSGAVCVPEALPRGPALRHLAQQGWNSGEAMDAALALPTYIRDKVAQTTAERASIKVAGSLR